MSRYARPNLSLVLAQHSIDEAREDLAKADAETGLVPFGAHDVIYPIIDQMIEHARAFGWTKLDEVVRHAGPTIDATSGVRVADHGRFLGPREAEALHLHRNLLLTLVLAGVLSYGGDATEIAKAFPKLKPRTHAQLRPYLDDETLLLRLWALHLSEGDKNNRRAAAVYAQCDTGLITGETTKISPSAVDLTPGGALIHSPGLDVGVASRVLPLDKYTTTLLQRYIDGAGALPGPLFTYRPREGDYSYSRAASSAICIIDRIRAAVGLDHRDTSNASVWMWRAATVELHHGIDEAVRLSGRSSADQLRALLRDRPKPPGGRPTNKKTKKLNID